MHLLNNIFSFCVCRCGGDGCFGLQFGEDALADAFNVFELFHRFEGTMLLAVVHNGFRFGRTDAGQGFQFGRRGGIDVDGCQRQRGSQNGECGKEEFFYTGVFLSFR